MSNHSPVLHSPFSRTFCEMPNSTHPSTWAHLSPRSHPGRGEVFAQKKMGIEALQTQAVSLFVCLAASVIEFSSTADECNTNSSCSDRKWAWGLACGVVSAFLCVLGLILTRKFLNRPAFVDMVVSFSLVLMWVFGAAFNTSTNGIFEIPRNGYFSTWYETLSSCW